jgi:predicted transcriptional regulator
LSKAEKEYLSKKRFIEEDYKNIFSNKKERYLVKPRFNETAPHCFLTYDIFNYLKQKNGIKNLLTPETKKPDITFMINSKEYGIEVETGKLLKTNKKALMEKIGRNNKEYSDRWFFVVTNRKIASRYAKLAQTKDKRSIKSKIDNLLKNSKKKSP